MTIIKIINESGNPTPTLATRGAAGTDIRAYINEPVMLNPLERKLIPNWTKNGNTLRVRSSNKTKK